MNTRGHVVWKWESPPCHSLRAGETASRQPHKLKLRVRFPCALPCLLDKCPIRSGQSVGVWVTPGGRLHASIVQWQNSSFVNCIRVFDSPQRLHGRVGEWFMPAVLKTASRKARRFESFFFRHVLVAQWQSRGLLTSRSGSDSLRGHHGEQALSAARLLCKQMGWVRFPGSPPSVCRSTGRSLPCEGRGCMFEPCQTHHQGIL